MTPREAHWQQVLKTRRLRLEWEGSQRPQDEAAGWTIGLLGSGSAAAGHVLPQEEAARGDAHQLEPRGARRRRGGAPERDIQRVSRPARGGRTAAGRSAAAGRPPARRRRRRPWPT